MLVNKGGFMLVIPVTSRLYQKAVSEGGSLFAGGKQVFRAFHTKDDKKFVQQLIGKDGSFETKIWDGDILVKTINKDQEHEFPTLKIWDNISHKGKQVLTINLSPKSFLQKVYKMDGIKDVDSKGTITQYTSGKKPC